MQSKSLIQPHARYTDIDHAKPNLQQSAVREHAPNFESRIPYLQTHVQCSESAVGMYQTRHLTPQLASEYHKKLCVGLVLSKRQRRSENCSRRPVRTSTLCKMTRLLAARRRICPPRSRSNSAAITRSASSTQPPAGNRIQPHNPVYLCGSCTLNVTGQCRVTLSRW